MADKEIPGLTAAGTLAGTDLVHIVDGDGNSRKMTLSALKTFVNTDPTVVPSSVAWRGARVYRTSDLSIANNTPSMVTWQAEDEDTDSIWSVGSPTRLVVPTGVTKVRLHANVRWEASSTGIRQVLFFKNGATFRGTGMFAQSAGSSTEQSYNIASAVIDVVATDYFELNVFHNSGGALNLQGLTRQDFVWFEMEIIEATI